MEESYDLLTQNARSEKKEAEIECCNEPRLFGEYSEFPGA